MAEAFRKEQMAPTGRDVSDPQKHEIADEDYDVISVIYHCLQGCETAKKYERDARDSGDGDLAGYFHQVQRTHLELANRGRQFLKNWVNREGVSEASAEQGRSNVAMNASSEKMSEASSGQAEQQVRDNDQDTSEERSQAV